MKRIMLVVMALILVLGLALTGCSPADVDTEGETVGADISELEDMLAEVSTHPDFTLDLEPLDAKAVMAGKKIMIIPQNSSNPFATGAAEIIASLLEEMGAEAFIWENKGNPTEWAAGCESAINQGYDFVELFGGANPGLIASSWDMLQDAGIPLMTTHYGPPEPIDNADYRLGVDFKERGILLAAWMIVNAGPDVNAALIAEFDTQSGPMIVEGFEETMAKYAPNAKYEVINVPINDWATKAQSEMQNAIQRNPDLDYLGTIYDSMLQWAIPAIEMTGKTGEIKTISYNGTPFILDMVREGKVEMDLGESIDQVAYASTDIVLRHFAGVDIVWDQEVPVYVFTQENASDAGVPAEYGLGYGEKYVQGYRAAWGLE